MIAALSAAMFAAAGSAPVSEPALSAAFRRLCLDRSGAPLSSLAERDGFRPVSLKGQLPRELNLVSTRGPPPAGQLSPIPISQARSDNRETQAWSGRGIRLFTTNGQTDPSWPLQAMCGVAAELRDGENLNENAERIGDSIGAVFMSGAVGRTNLSVTFFMDTEEMVRLVMVRRRGLTTATLLVELPPIEEAAQ